MELVIQESALRELVEVRRFNHASGGAGAAETEIIEEDHHHIWCILRRFHFEHRRCLGIPRIKCRDRRVPRSLEGQFRAVDLGLLLGGQVCGCHTGKDQDGKYQAP